MGLSRGTTQSSVGSQRMQWRHFQCSHVRELGQPFFLFVIDMISDGLVHSFVGLFTITISLGVVRGGHC